MTREEAINELQSYADNSWGGLNEAFEMAISALREQSNCIEFESINRTESDTVKLVEIDHVKPVWISVKERLPETYTNVIVLHENGHTGIEWRYKHSPCYKTANFLFDPLYGEVTHWMPLPEPPKGE